MDAIVAVGPFGVYEGALVGSFEETTRAPARIAVKTDVGMSANREVCHIAASSA